MSTKQPGREHNEVFRGDDKRTKLNHPAETTASRLMLPLQKRNPADYTVGWICAISTTYVATQAFLDAKHDTPDKISHIDNNNYTLGKMGQHNVVIAALPMGEYGTASAGKVATDMIRTFPNVRIVLMVGTAGGAPTEKQDIRLGDVVVGISPDGKSGVLQYDFGKVIQGKGFQVTGQLNQPPMILRNAVSTLRAQYEKKGHQLEEAVNGILQQWPRLRSGYKRPDPNTDKLYRSEVMHRGSNEKECAKVCGCDPSKIVTRKRRTQYDNKPAIHYGTIASADILMKDALIRDRFAKEKGILCFEMEAAGLMNHFPCLVIRGICNYSDTHKNKEWQGYAAMVQLHMPKTFFLLLDKQNEDYEKNQRHHVS